MCVGTICGKRPGSRYIECMWCNTKVAVGCCAATGSACHRCTQKEWGTWDFVTDEDAYPLCKWVSYHDGNLLVQVQGYSGRVHLEDIGRISDVISCYMMEGLVHAVMPTDALFNSLANVLWSIYPIKHWEQYTKDVIKREFPLLIAAFVKTKGGTAKFLELAMDIYRDNLIRYDKTGPHWFDLERKLANSMSERHVDQFMCNLE